jgi:hypothetical protein
MRKIIGIITWILLALASTSVLIMVILDNMAEVPTMGAHWLGYVIAGYGYLTLMVNFMAVKKYVFETRSKSGRSRYPDDDLFNCDDDFDGL